MVVYLINIFWEQHFTQEHNKKKAKMLEKIKNDTLGEYITMENNNAGKKLKLGRKSWKDDYTIGIVFLEHSH